MGQSKGQVSPGKSYFKRHGLLFGDSEGLSVHTCADQSRHGTMFLEASGRVEWPWGKEETSFSATEYIVSIAVAEKMTPQSYWTDNPAPVLMIPHSAFYAPLPR